MVASSSEGRSLVEERRRAKEMFSPCSATEVAWWLLENLGVEFTADARAV